MGVHVAPEYAACLPPLFVRCLSYLYLYYLSHSHDFFFNLHLHYWGLCVILAVESANIGGIIGEVLMHVYHRKGRVHNHQKDAEFNATLSSQ